MVASDGGVFAFGDAPFHGSATQTAGSQPVVGMATTPDGSGNWIATGGRDLGVFVVTCYTLQGSTATGSHVDNDTAAVDPSVIPLGTRVFVDSVGARTAKDTGADIKGNRLDVWSPSADDCRNFGRQSLHVWGES
jgi:3D (Asp-Asp-Asp) domain-containing protein